MIGACRIFRSDTETIGYQLWRSGSQVVESSSVRRVPDADISQGRGGAHLPRQSGDRQLAGPSIFELDPHRSISASRPLLASAITRSTTATAGGSRVAEHPGLPPTSEMLGWIDEVVARGIRRPGYPADRWA